MATGGELRARRGTRPNLLRRYLQRVPIFRLRGLLLAALLTAGLSVAGPAAGAVHTAPPSRLLWATIDICHPASHPRTIGIRGSMPGTGRSDEVMLMRFRVQYLDRATHAWRYVSQGADSGYVSVGSATYRGRQSGYSFPFASPPRGGTYTVRGVVAFQWRRHGRVVRHAVEHSSKGHHVTTGADPPGYSAATCTVGAG